MAIDLSVTPGELEYQATQCFIGKAYKVFLAYRGATALGVGSTVGQWEAVEVAAANGYEAQEGTIVAGAYSSARTRYELERSVPASLAPARASPTTPWWWRFRAAPTPIRCGCMQSRSRCSPDLRQGSRSSWRRTTDEPAG